MSKFEVINGDLFDQEVEVIVNAWNRNFIPWWLLLPQGVSGALRRKAGTAPFRELSKIGLLAAGDAVITSAGKLSYKAIIHVAGISAFWIATEYTIRTSIQNALQLAEQKRFSSIAFPLIGAGTGGKRAESVQQWIEEEVRQSAYSGRVVLVLYQP